MKLIYIANARIPTEKAHGLSIMKMCGAFAENADVELWAMRRLNPIKKDPFDYYVVRRNFCVKKLPCLDFIPLVKYLGSAAFWLTELSFLFFVGFSLIRSRGDVVYTRDKSVASLLSLLGRAVFFEAHSLPSKIFLGALKKARGVVVVTENLKQILCVRGIPQNKILVAPNGVDIAQFDIVLSKEDACKKVNFSNGKIYIGYVGTLRTLGMEKGIRELIDAFKILKRVVPNLSVVIVGGGDGGIGGYKRVLAEKNVSEEDFVFIGTRPHEEVPIYMKAFDVLVMPFPRNTHYAYYMSPLKLFEYMASKRPIVATSLPAAGEILNKSNAVLVEPGNFKNLAMGIERVVRDRKLSEEISAQAFRDVQEYSWEKRSRNIINFIQSKIQH